MVACGLPVVLPALKEDYDEKNAKVVNKKYADEIAIMLLLAKFIAEAQVTQEQLDQSIK